MPTKTISIYLNVNNYLTKLEPLIKSIKTVVQMLGGNKDNFTPEQREFLNGLRSSLTLIGRCRLPSCLGKTLRGSLNLNMI